MIVPKSNGHLMCEDCGTYWCLHVEKAVKESQDTAWIWEENYPDPVQLEVPIIPTSNLWATVLLEKPDRPASMMYRVEYHMVVTGDGVFIGFIHPSEGRSVLRSMLLDWFTGTQAQDNMDCKSRGHGFNQITRLQRDMNNPSLRVAQQWSIWATGKCLGCTYDSDKSADLVPDVAPSHSPWR